MPVPRARCNPTNPNSVVWAWGPGVSSFVAPNGTGLPILGDSGCDFLQVGLRVCARGGRCGLVTRVGFRPIADLALPGRRRPAGRPPAVSRPPCCEILKDMMILRFEPAELTMALASDARSPPGRKQHR